MKQLDLEYLSGAGKVQHIKFKYVNENLAEKEVRKLMSDLAELKLFSKDNVEMYVKPCAARYVETTRESIFEDKTDTNMETQV